MRRSPKQPPPIHDSDAWQNPEGRPPPDVGRSVRWLALPLPPPFPPSAPLTDRRPMTYRTGISNLLFSSSSVSCVAPGLVAPGLVAPGPVCRPCPARLFVPPCLWSLAPPQQRHPRVLDNRASNPASSAVARLCTFAVYSPPVSLHNACLPVEKRQRNTRTKLCCFPRGVASGVCF